MRQAFNKFGSANGRHPLNREIAIAEGSHILLCELYKSDKDKIIRESNNFIEDVVRGWFLIDC